MSHYGYATEGRAVPTCLRCGALVTNQPLHDQFHESLVAAEEIAVQTAANLLAALLALIGEDEESTVVQ
jgi:hypothetical protein